MTQQLVLAAVEPSAVFSACRTWRYTLTRRWSTQPGRMAVWVMLNPSIADEHHLDATLRRCRSFSTREGCVGMTVLNLYALVSTNPAGLYAVEDPIGPENDAHITEVLANRWSLLPPLVICAWGAHPKAAERSEGVLRLIRGLGYGAWCLGLTKSGAPKHPVRLAASTPLVAVP